MSSGYPIWHGFNIDFNQSKMKHKSNHSNTVNFLPAKHLHASIADTEHELSSALTKPDSDVASFSGHKK